MLPTGAAPAHHLIDRLMIGVAGSLLILLLLRAALTYDPYFDSAAYHLPFAARVSGICPKSCFLMSEYLEAAYDGFPKLFHRVQGLLWRISAHAQAVDLLNVGALVLFCLYLRLSFRVPAAWTFCALIAIPLVQIHATSTYVDLPANLAAAVAILGLVDFMRAPEAFGWRKMVVLLGCLAIAANSKPQMVAVVAPIGGLFGLVAFTLLASGRQVGPFKPKRLSGWFGLSCLLVISGAVISATLIDNSVRHANPFYPIRLTLLGVVFEGPIDGDAIGADSLASVWQSVASPLRWVASVLEYGAYAGRELPWTYDQGFCRDVLAWRDCRSIVVAAWLNGGVGFRIGGYFVPYVLALLAFFAWAQAGTNRPTRRIFAATLIGITVLAAFLPRSHELRYYLFWMIVLVALCLISAFDRTQPSPGDPPGANTAFPSLARRSLLGVIVLSALASVVLVTQARYLDPTGPSLDDTIDALGIRAPVAQLPDGAVVCAGDAGWQPFTFLFATVFHPDRSYELRDRPVAWPCTAKLPKRES